MAEDERAERMFQKQGIGKDNLVDRVKFLRSLLNLPNTEIPTERLPAVYENLCEQFNRTAISLQKSLQYSD